jgi:hypothetical protein
MLCQSKVADSKKEGNREVNFLVSPHWIAAIFPALYSLTKGTEFHWVGPRYVVAADFCHGIVPPGRAQTRHL